MLLIRKRKCFIPGLSTAWPSGSERRFYDDHDSKVDGSTPTLVVTSFHKMLSIIISAWWNLTRSKLNVKSNTKLEYSETKTTRKQVWIRPMCSTSVDFS